MTQPDQFRSNELSTGDFQLVIDLAIYTGYMAIGNVAAYTVSVD